MAWTLLAAGLTPLLLFVTSTTKLYALNASTFSYDPIVLRRYHLAALAAYAAGAALLGVTAALGRSRWARLPMGLCAWSYLLLGPAFLAYVYLHGMMRSVFDSPVVLAIFAAAFVGGVVALARKAPPMRAFRNFGLAFLLFAAIEAWTFAAEIYQSEPRKSGNRRASAAQQAEKKPSRIYHLLLDEFQTDGFEAILDDEVRESLAGFHFFPNNRSVYSFTGLSVSSVMMAKPMDFSRPKIEYEERAFNDPDSLAGRLSQAGYHTRMYLAQFGYLRERRAFDEEHGLLYQRKVKISPERAQLNKWRFFSLWAFSNLPACVAGRVADKRDVELVKRGVPFLFSGTVEESLSGFMQFLADEKKSAPGNTYSYVHVFAPHGPYVLRADGSFGSQPTDLRQSARGSMALAGKMIALLKEKGVFDDALILIHADHGSDGQWLKPPRMVKEFSEEFAQARSRSLMLVKFPGQKADRPLQTHSTPTHLFDVAPTVLDAAGLPHGDLAGYPLNAFEHIPSDRKRPFWAFDYNELSERDLYQPAKRFKLWTIEADGSMRSE